MQSALEYLQTHHELIFYFGAAAIWLLHFVRQSADSCDNILSNRSRGGHLRRFGPHARSDECERTYVTALALWRKSVRHLGRYIDRRTRQVSYCKERGEVDERT